MELLDQMFVFLLKKSGFKYMHKSRVGFIVYTYLFLQSLTLCCYDITFCSTCYDLLI